MYGRFGTIATGGDTVNMTRTFIAAAISTAVFLLVLAVPASAAERIALVIGNAKYPKMGDLRNPANDARAMADKLRKLDFELVGGKAHVNVTRSMMLRLLNRLEDRLRPTMEATALVYYSGHGLATDGDNWLVPVDDSEIEYRENVPDYAIAARKGILSRLEDRGGGLNVVILDACRNNELPARRKIKGSLSKGLARYESANSPNTVLAYAAAPGAVAYDGEGDLSPYVQALLAEMDTPGKRLIDVLSDTARAVQRATDRFPFGPQKPHMEFQTLPRKFFFVPASVQGGPSQTAQPQQPLKVALQVEKGSEAEVAAGRKPDGEGVVRDLEFDSEFQDCPQCPRMVVVPAGTYEMGSPSDQGADDEEQRHRVAIAEPMAIGMFEVKRREFIQFVEETGGLSGGACWQYDGIDRKEGSGPRDPGFIQGADEPVVCVSWTDAQAYVDWLSKKTQREYRLLTESEWEYAARGGTVTARYWDESESAQCGHANGADDALRARYADWFPLTASCDDGQAHTAEAGRYGPNRFGLHDMLGNAREWVEDCWHHDYDGAPEDGRAWTDGGNCRLRVLRGGSWLDGPGGVRSSTRDKSTAGIRFSANGFRVARALN